MLAESQASTCPQQVATFSDTTAELTSGLQPAEQAKAAVLSAQYLLGSTYTGAALQAAGSALGSGSHATKIVLLITDGVADDADTAQSSAQQLRDSGATVVTLGIAPADPSVTLDEGQLRGLASTDSAGQPLYALASGFDTLVPTLQALLEQQLCL